MELTMSTQSSTHTVLPAAAIDVGFFSTKLSYGTRSGPNGTEISVDQFPSLSSRTSSDFKSLPNSVQHDGAYVMVDDVSYFVGKSVLQLMGSAGGLRAPHANYSETPTYKALMLGAFHYMARHYKTDGSLTIKNLVLGLPLSTIFSHGELLKKSAVGEHVIPSVLPGGRDIRVTVQNVVVVCQPQGALMNYSYQLGKNVGKDKMLVLDLGGGTFDWFIVDAMKPNYIISGAAPIGALACVTAVCDLLNPRFKSDPAVLSKIDVALRNNDESVRIAGNDHLLAPLWPTVHSVVKEGLEQMLKKVGSLDSMDHILLTGGGAKLLEHSAKTELAEFSKIIIVDKDPVFANVRGFHLIAQMIGGQP